ncbi:MAG: putative LPS assembly protein LptD, partial [Flavobacteriales bacterium]
MRFNVKEQKMYLFGKAKVTYMSMVIEADYIEMDMKKNEFYASGVPDSTGELAGKPVFKDGEQGFTSQTMRYNFETKKGKITEAITQEGDGYIHGKEIKREDEKILYIKDGKYTTCNKEEPHFYIEAKKLKVIKDKEIITGPAYLVIADVPTPLAVPFGIFPNKKGQSSGIVMPTYGESPGLGFYLSNGGYYFALNDYMDLTLTGDIYSRGSWGLNAITQYKNRYKYSGSLDVSYSLLRNSDPEFPDFSKSSSFFVRWKHMQDAKARPNSRFTADVNAGSSNNFKNDFSSTTTDYLTSSFSSNISYTYTFPNKPFAFTLNGSHSQNTADSTVSLTLPQVTFTMSRIYPFKRKVSVGRKRWYEKIGVSYTANAKNTLKVKEDSVFTPYALGLMRNGMMHKIPVSTSMKLGRKGFLSFFTFNPSLGYSEKWYMESIEKRWENDSLITDTIPGFSRFGEASASASLSTRLYGSYAFKEGSAVKAIRHVISPSASITYKPDYSDPHYGYYKTVQADTLGNEQQYSIFDIGIYGKPSTNEAGVLNLSLQNTLEMKVKSEKDSVKGEKKIKLFDAFNFSSSYNLFSDSLNWSPVRLNVRTNPLPFLNLRFTGSFDPYGLDSLGRRFNTTEWDINKEPVRITDLSATADISLKSKQSPQGKKESEFASEEELELINNNPNLYIDFNVPWSLNLSYTLRYSKPKFTETITNSLSCRGDVRITKGWKIGFTSGYDFELHEMTLTTLDIYRDLHCWEMRVNVVPFGDRKRYEVNINVKSSVLQDLKLTRKRDWYDYQQ